MKKEVIAIAPHPDDESFGCGGTLLRHKAEGDSIHWLIMTNIHTEHGYSQNQVNTRKKEIKKVVKMYGFDSVHALDFPTTKLDTIPLGDIINKISAVFTKVKPNILYLPYRSDIHSDHRIVYEASIACTKWFRYPFVRNIYSYETLSETDMEMDSTGSGFHPNVYIDIKNYLDKKIEIINIYASELGYHPFPRSEKALKAKAIIRGVAAGFEAAEGFILLKEIK